MKLYDQYLPITHREYADCRRSILPEGVRAYATTYNRCRRNCSPLCCFRTVWAELRSGPFAMWADHMGLVWGRRQSLVGWI